MYLHNLPSQAHVKKKNFYVLSTLQVCTLSQAHVKNTNIINNGEILQGEVGKICLICFNLFIYNLLGKLKHKHKYYINNGEIFSGIYYIYPPSCVVIASI